MFARVAANVPRLASVPSIACFTLLLRMGKNVFNHHDRVVYYHPAANTAKLMIFSDRPNKALTTNTTILQLTLLRLKFVATQQQQYYTCQHSTSEQITLHVGHGLVSGCARMSKSLVLPIELRQLC